METYRIWSGTRTFLPGDDSEYTIEAIVAEELGMWEDADYDSGRTYYVYAVEDGIVIHLVRWTTGIGEPHYGSIHRFSGLSEAAQSEFGDVLKAMRLI
jgi:hypothetical protein